MEIEGELLKGKEKRMISTACYNTAENWVYSTTQEQEEKQTAICYTAIRNTGEKKPLEVLQSSPSLRAGQSPDISPDLSAYDISDVWKRTG